MPVQNQLVVEHPKIDTRPHLGTSLALLVTCSSDLLFPVLSFILFQTIYQCNSEILANHLICDITSTNFHQDSIDFRLGPGMFSCYLLGLFLLKYSSSQLLQLIIIQHGFRLVNGRLHYLNWIRLTPHLLCQMGDLINVYVIHIANY